jgi:uncharacterized membrane protein
VEAKAESFVSARRVYEPLTRTIPLSASFFVCLAAAVYATVASLAAALSFDGFRTARFDLGNAVQAIWSTSHGDVLQMTNIDGTQVARFGSHVEPVLLVFAPLWLVWSSPVLLVVVQAVTVSAGALPVFWLARKHLRSERAAASFALAYLIYPATQWKALDPNTGFHAVDLALPLLLYALWWLDEERWVPFAIAAVLAAATKEQIPMTVGCLGLWYGFSHRRMRVGLPIFAVGFALTALEFLYVIPHFNPGRVSPFASRYGAVGGSPIGILETTAFHPLRLAEVVLTGHKLVYLATLVLPLLGLCFRAPLTLAAVPALAINLLSSSPDQTSISGHYGAATAAVLFGATILGAARTNVDPRLLATGVLAGVTVSAVLSPLWIAVPVARATFDNSPRLRAERHAVSLIPPHVSVSTSNIIGAHLSARRRIMLFPAVEGAQWIVVDTTDTEGASPFNPVISRLRRTGGYVRVFEAHGVVVLRRSTEPLRPS